MFVKLREKFDQEEKAYRNIVFALIFMVLLLSVVNIRAGGQMQDFKRQLNACEAMSNFYKTDANLWQERYKANKTTTHTYVKVDKLT